MNTMRMRLGRVFIFAMAMLLMGFATSQAQEKEVRKEVRVEMQDSGEGPGAPAFMGVLPRPLDHVLRAALNYEEAGVLLEEVVPEGPAAKAGVKVGEILVKVDGTPVHDSERLMAIMRGKKVGDKVDLQLFHLGKVRTVKVELAARPAPPKPKAIWFGKDDDEGFAPEALGPGDEMGQALDEGMRQVEIQLDGLDLNLEELDRQLEGLNELQDDSNVRVKVLRLNRDSQIN
jgi:hypothetical protein